MEDKITETLNKVRHDKNFQNPILRLGKTGNTYSQILSTASVENIKKHFRAVKKEYEELESDIDKLGNSLKEDIQAEVFANEDIDIKEIVELIELESNYQKNGFPIQVDKSFESPDAGLQLEELRSLIVQLGQNLSKHKFNLEPISKPSEKSINNIKTAISVLEIFISGFQSHLDSKDFRLKSFTLLKENINLEPDRKDFQELEVLQGLLSQDHKVYDLFGVEKPIKFLDVFNLLNLLSGVKSFSEKLKSNFGPRLSELSKPITVTDFNAGKVQWFINQYENIKLPIVNYLFAGKKVKELNVNFVSAFNSENFGVPHRNIKTLKEISSIISEIEIEKENFGLKINFDFIGGMTTLIKDENIFKEFSIVLSNVQKYTDIVSRLKNKKWFEIFNPVIIDDLNSLSIANKAVSVFKKYEQISDLSEFEKFNDLSDFLKKDQLSKIIDALKGRLHFLETIVNSFDEITNAIAILKDHPSLLKKIKLSLGTKAFVENDLLEINDSEYSRFVRYITLKQKIEKDFSNVPFLEYALQKKNIEDLVTTKMTYLLDSRLIDFYENSRGTAKALQNIIKTKQRFPRNEFQKLKEAFPCILAGIRDYAEYIPLEPEMFDLLIIDEASQVSIAQAFPALLRAKKVLVLGDKKQFSNVKSAQARLDMNREYLTKLKDTFIEFVSQDGTSLAKLEKFNVKTSILEFFEFISNYHAQLLKHFRGYKELISYSNKYFYQDGLQVMKIRGKPIDEVLKFTFIQPDGEEKILQNTNLPECEFIISELKKITASGMNPSIGIITPHTNQQKLLVEKIGKLPEESDLYEKSNLKIMTFDTCQGEEKDIIFYSMVATESNDRLWGVFIKDLKNADIEEDGKIKAQRLNVGLSRAKECIHFILSKPLENYNGSIGEALRHYSLVLYEAKKEHDASETDPKSKMEPKVLDWFYKTIFWSKNKERIDFRPGFELGRYLKQLDKSYDHPYYKVDFLMLYKDNSEKEHKLIIEYDGFLEHFGDSEEEVNELNYENYYSENDVFRQKVLEGYGYKFIRINKFNLKDEPVKKMDEMIEAATRKGLKRNNRIDHIHETIDGLETGLMKECPKCKEIRNLSEFKDSSRITGYGRFCRICKGLSSRIINQNPAIITVCPQCGSKMRLIESKYGKFYGCTRYPYCKGKRSYLRQTSST